MMTQESAPMRFGVAEALLSGASMTSRPVQPVRLPADEKNGVRGLYAALQPFWEIRLDMPSQLIAFFLLVAMDEGQSVQYYCDRAGVSKSVGSRHIMDLSVQTRHMEPGLGLLVARPHPMELRRHEVFLTPKGLAMARKILALWQLTAHDPDEMKRPR